MILWNKGNSYKIEIKACEWLGDEVQSLTMDSDQLEVLIEDVEKKTEERALEKALDCVKDIEKRTDFLTFSALQKELVKHMDKASKCGVTYAEMSKALKTLCLQDSYTLPVDKHNEFWELYATISPSILEEIAISIGRRRMREYNLWNFLHSIFPGVTSDKYKIDLDSAPNIKIVRKEEPKGKLGVL
jgi:hypothetical protein